MQSCEIPEDLVVIPPGAGLAAALDVIELARVPNDRMLEVLRAQYRLLCHEQARMAAVLAELGRCAGFPEPGEVRRLASPDRFAAEESRAALCWTRRAAEDEHDLAEALVSQWPAVFTAWLAGDIDRPRVRVFERYLTGLNEAQVASVCRVAVPKASRSTTGQLAVLLRRLVIAVDPDAAARWYRKAVADRNVIAYAGPDGTITLSANGLPADEAEAACIRLQDLASSAKRAGHPGLIGQIRCDLFLGMLDGRFHHLTSEQVIAALLADHRAAEPGEPQEASAPPDASAPVDAQPVDAQPADAQPADAQPADAQPADARPAGARPPDDWPDPSSVHDQRVGIEIRIGLATLLGLDERPAEIPGLGLLVAPEARRRVAIQGRAQWRFALTDPEGRLVFDGITRRRPCHIRRNGPPGGIVELHIPSTLLSELSPGGPLASEDWADLIADITAQHALGDDQRLDLDAHPGARLPGAALRRHTEIRDRACTFVGCRRRAHATQQDHSHDHHLGGATVRGNLGPLCVHDHQVKHLGGWRVEQREPRTFVWRSPLGGSYRTTGEPFLPQMPDLEPAGAGPVPAAPGPDRGEALLDERVGPILRHSAPARTPRRSQQQPLESVPRWPPPRGSPGDPAPF